jgi:hypothetical protein
MKTQTTNKHQPETPNFRKKQQHNYQQQTTIMNNIPNFTGT